ncbi:MAG TPA: GGDEF domain-containing protein [Pirellulales bacterium]
MTVGGGVTRCQGCRLRWKREERPILDTAISSLTILIFVFAALGSLAVGAMVGWHIRGFRDGAEPVLPAKPTVSPARALPAAPAPAPAASETVPEQAPPPGLEPAKVRDLLERIHQLADSAAAGVGEHTSRVEQISQELAALSADGGVPLEEAILSAAARLVEANEHLETELATAKNQLDEHARQIESHMAEARTDGLVGVANRRAFDEELERQCKALKSQGLPFYLVLLDVDHFKQFNDRHGHQAGDEVLKGVGRILSETVREQDFVARYGGEEFAVIVPETTSREAKATAEQIRSAVESGRFDYNGQQLQVTASLGMAGAVVGQEPKALIQRADEALYAAKKNGRNRAYFFNGQTCEVIDPAWFEANADVVQAVKRELDQASSSLGSNRRCHARRPFPTHQYVAPYVNGILPALTEFYQVQCHDISPTGFSYLLAKPAENQAIVVALGSPPNVTYLTARVMHSTMTHSGGAPMFLIGCRFTGRVEPQGEYLELTNAEQG